MTKTDLKCALLKEECLAVGDGLVACPALERVEGLLEVGLDQGT